MCRLVIITAIGLFVGTTQGVLAIEQPNAGKEKPKHREGYASPREAFEALNSSDLRASYYSRTQSLRETTILECLFYCMEVRERQPKMEAFLNRHGVHADKISAEYHHKKFGVAPPLETPSTTNRANAGKLVPAPKAATHPYTQEDGLAVLREMARQIPDKAAFFEEMGALNESLGKEAGSAKPLLPSPNPKLGELEELSINGETAQGFYNSTWYYLRSTTGSGKMQVLATTHREKCIFTRVNGRWFVGGTKKPETSKQPSKVTPPKASSTKNSPHETRPRP